MVVVVTYWIAPHYGPLSQVCHKGDYGPPDQCAQWNAVAAPLVRLLYWADEHNGLVTAFAGIVVAIFTARLWRTQRETVAIAATQTDISNAQASIARDQFLAEHRPKLVLKDVYFSSDDDFAEVTFEIGNVGSTTACIQSGFVALEFVRDSRQFKSSEGRSLEPLSRSGFSAASLRPFAIRTTDEMQENLGLLQFATGIESAPSGPHLYFFGVLRYTDIRGAETGVVRTSVFRRLYRPDDGTFRRTGDPDHEYAD